MRTQRQTQSRSSLRQLLRWGALLLVVVFGLPVLLWFVANRFDESPSQEALDYAAKPTRKVADADNAWLVLAGIGAAEGDDPIAFGRLRVDMLDARVQKRPLPPADAAETALFVDPVPYVGPDTSVDGTDALCPIREENCVAWAGKQVPMLERLREANALRLSRWQAALDKPDWQALYPTLLDGPVVDPSIATLHLNLLALDLHRTLPFMPANATPLESTEPTTLEQLASTVAFWRRVQASPQDLMTTLIAARQIENAQRIADAWLSWRSASAGAREEAALDQILAPPVGSTDWRVAMSHEFQLFERTMGDTVVGPWGVIRQCANGTVEGGCLKTFMMQSAYAPQATLNLHARHRRIMENMLEADPMKYKASELEAAFAFEDTFVRYDETGTLFAQMAYNFSGRILAQIAIPAFDWGLRGHDQEAIRRIIVLKREALRRQVAGDDMPAFLSEQDAALRDPFTGEPFGWDPETSTIHFTPGAAKYWNVDTLRIVY